MALHGAQCHAGGCGWCCTRQRCRSLSSRRSLPPVPHPSYRTPSRALECAPQTTGPREASVGVVRRQRSAVAGSPPSSGGLYYRWSSGDEEGDEEAIIGRARSRPPSSRSSSCRLGSTRPTGRASCEVRVLAFPFFLSHTLTHGHMDARGRAVHRLVRSKESSATRDPCKSQRSRARRCNVCAVIVFTFAMHAPQNACALLHPHASPPPLMYTAANMRMARALKHALRA